MASVIRVIQRNNEACFEMIECTVVRQNFVTMLTANISILCSVNPFQENSVLRSEAMSNA